MANPNDSSGTAHRAPETQSPATNAPHDCVGSITKSPAGRLPIRFGLLEGRFSVPTDFDAPLPDDVQALFEGPTSSF